MKFFLFTYIVFFGCVSQQVSSENLNSDSFVGVWKGEHNVSEGVWRRWVQTIRPDGTFLIQHFTFEKSELTDMNVQGGMWSYSDGVIEVHVLHDGEKIGSAKYNVTSVSENRISYSQIGRDYSFEDTKLLGL